MRSTRFLLIAATAAACSRAPLVFAFSQTPQDDPATLREYHGGNGLLTRGMNDLAVKEYRAFLEKHAAHPKAALARYGLAVALTRLNLPEEAITELDQLEAAGDFEFAAEAALLQGQCRMTLGRHAEAADALWRLVRNHPDHALAPDGGALLAEALHRAGRHDEVDLAADFTARRAPGTPQHERTLFFQGLSHLALERYDSAHAIFEAQVERFPDGALASRGMLLSAKALHQAGKLDQAAEAYAHAIERGDATTLPEALYGLGAIQRHNGNAAEAARSLDRILAEFPEAPAATLARFERARAHFDLEEFDLAREAFQKTLDESDTLDDQAIYWLAKCDLREDEAPRAASRLAEAIAAYPDSPLIAEMRYDRAVALWRAKEIDQAATALREFHQAHPDHALAPDAIHLLASALHARGEYDASAALAKEFLNGHADHELAPFVAFLLAENEFLAGRLSEATTLYARFLEANEAHVHAPDAAFRLGLALQRLGELEAALPHLESVAKGAATPETFRPALLALGDIHFARGEWESAETRYGEYLEAAGDGAAGADDALLKRGLALARQAKFDQAVASFDRLLSAQAESPQRLQAMFERGQALVALDRTDEAIAAFTATIEADGNSRFVPHALNHLGALAMKDGAPEYAAAFYERLASSDADSALRVEALFQQGQAWMSAGRHVNAAQVFGAFLEQHAAHERAPMARANYALSLARSGEHEEALAAIGAAERVDDSSLPAEVRIMLAYEKAWCLRLLDRMDEASEAYRALLNLGGEHDLAHHARVELAELEAAAGRHDIAAELLHPLLATASALSHPLRARALYRLGASEFELERHEAALAAFEPLLAGEADAELMPSAQLLSGESLFLLGRHEAAIDHLRAASADEAPASIREPALLRLGESLAAMQRWAESEEAFQTHLEQFPESELWFQSRFGVGFALENSGKHDEAMNAYREVTDRHDGPTAARAQFQIGECLFAQKKYDEAVRELLKVDILYAYPEWSAAALYEAGRCFESLSQIAEAKRQFEQVQSRFADTRWATLAATRLAALAKPDLPGRTGQD